MNNSDSLSLSDDTVVLPFGADYREVAVGSVVWLAQDEPFQLDCGTAIRNFPLAYRTYGTLNADKSNAIFICHGLTGDQYVAFSSSCRRLIMRAGSA